MYLVAIAASDLISLQWFLKQTFTPDRLIGGTSARSFELHGQLVHHTRSSV